MLTRDDGHVTGHVVQAVARIVGALDDLDVVDLEWKYASSSLVPAWKLLGMPSMSSLTAGTSPWVLKPRMFNPVERLWQLRQRLHGNRRSLLHPRAR
jgi:hypothetical protein